MLWTNDRWISRECKFIDIPFISTVFIIFAAEEDGTWVGG